MGGISIQVSTPLDLEAIYALRGGGATSPKMGSCTSAPFSSFRILPAERIAFHCLFPSFFSDPNDHVRSSFHCFFALSSSAELSSGVVVDRSLLFISPIPQFGICTNNCSLTRNRQIRKK